MKTMDENETHLKPDYKVTATRAQLIEPPLRDLETRVSLLRSSFVIPSVSPTGRRRVLRG